jgi:alkyl hydroperoxide reductase subunit AhpC
LRDRASELESRNAEVVIVTFEALPIAKAYVAETKLTWPVIVDRERTLYHAYGMEHARWIDLVGPRAIWLYLKLIARGNRVRLPTDDTRQRGGDVVIDPQGIVRLHAVANGPAGRVPIEKLLAVMQTS